MPFFLEQPPILPTPPFLWENSECPILLKTQNFEKQQQLYGPFLWMGFNCLKARATSRRQFTFYH